VARRYLGSRRKEKKLSTSLLSILGIAIGVLALNGVIGVMNGFQLGTIEDILELNSFHVQWQPDPESFQEAPVSVLAQRAMALAEVRHALPYYDTQALVQGNFVELQGVYIRAVDPTLAATDHQGNDLRALVQGKLDPSPPGTIILGRELARFLGVGAGDTISLVSLEGPDLDLRNPREVTLEVRGIFASGYYPYDRNWAMISLETLVSSFGTQVQPNLGIKLEDRFGDIQALAAFRTLEESGTLLSWRELNRAIFGALRVEKGLMMFLVSLIFLVVGVNIYQGLGRIIHERTRDIGVFKALGASPGTIQGVFVLEGWIIGLVGSSVGTVLGLLLGWNLNGLLNFFGNLLGQTGSFSLQYFYISEIPVRFVGSEVFLIGVFGLASAVLAAWVASYSVRDLAPVDVFREE